MKFEYKGMSFWGHFKKYVENLSRWPHKNFTGMFLRHFLIEIT